MKLSAEKLREVTIELCRPTVLDPLRCRDGEIEDGAGFFSEGSGDDVGGEGDAGGGAASELGFSGIFELPEGARVICMHRIDGGEERVHAVIQYASGRLRYVDMSHASAGVVDIAYTAVDEVLKGTVAGDYLVMMSSSDLLWAKWDRPRGRYLWLGGVPAPPSPKYTLAYKPLPPYSTVAGDLPQIEVEVYLADTDGERAYDWLSGRNTASCPNDVRRKVLEAVSLKFNVFLEDVAAAGMRFARHYAVATWTLAGSRAWNPSETFILGISGDVEGEIVSSVFSAGCLRISLRLSRCPNVVEASGDLDDIPETWASIIEGISIVEGEEAEMITSSPSDAVWLDAGRRGFVFRSRALESNFDFSGRVAGRMDPYGVPSDIDGIGGRLFSIYGKGDFDDVNLLAVSDTVFPFACSGVGEIAGGRLIKIEHSLRSLSSGQFGDFPLYAFCSDGIRALTPSDGAFRDVQLISRDVPVSVDAFAPTDSGVCLVSERGVLRVEGSSVTNLSAKLSAGWSWDGTSRIAYVYGQDELIVYNEEGIVFAYDFNTSKWRQTRWHEEGVRGMAHWYAWPETFFLSGNRIGRLAEEAAGIRRIGISEAATVSFATRPVKFGLPFAEKRLLYVEAVWPDGVARPIEVYGANRLDVWHCLGRNDGGKIRLRGSGWRFFRFESFLKRKLDMENDEKIIYLKPLIYCKICDIK